MESERRPGLVISPSGIGEVLDLGFNLARRNFKFLASLTLWGVVPSAVLTGFGSVAVAGGNGSEAGGFVAFGLAVVIASILGLITEGAVVFACARLIEGQTDQLTAGTLYQASLRRLGWFFLFGIVIALAAGPLIIILPLGIFVGVRWAVSWVALFVEQTGPLASLGRSWALTRGSWWHTAVVVLTTSMIIGAISWAVGTVVGAAGAVLGAVTGSAVVTALISAAVGVASGVITTPFSVAILVVLYYELRARAEGFDLELRARQILPNAALDSSLDA